VERHTIWFTRYEVRPLSVNGREPWQQRFNAFAPPISKNLGARKVPITCCIEGKKRSAEIPNIPHMAVDPLPTMHPSGDMWANVGHPVSPDKLALAMGATGSTFTDHRTRWDNYGKNGHYAPISWSSS
jgi:hypothetical protein